MQCPLTVDYGGFLLALNDLRIDTIPRGGTSISSAIEEAMQSFDSNLNKYKILIIITDGENNEGDPVRLAEKAAKEGIKIFCIGIGTKEGELIQIVDENGKTTFLKDREGNVVKSSLNEDMLQKITSITGAAYVRSSGSQFGLDFIYDEKLSKMERRDTSTQMDKLYYERFQIPLSFALILLLIEPFISDRKKT